MWRDQPRGHPEVDPDTRGQEKPYNHGMSFEPFPSLPDGRASAASCLETLDNGGDIFAQVKEWDSGRNLNRTYIFRANSSTWERQPDRPGEVGPEGWWYTGVLACGPVRSDPGSSVEEIVVIVGDYYNDVRLVYIFNIASSSWRTGMVLFDLHFHTEVIIQ